MAKESFIIVLAWLLTIAGVGIWQRSDGRVAEREAWQARENADLRAANAAIARLQTEARAGVPAEGVGIGSGEQSQGRIQSAAA